MGKIKTIKPIIFADLDSAPRARRLIDIYPSMLQEKFIIENPQFKDSDGKTIQKELTEYKAKEQIGECWIYYPHMDILVHSLDEQAYFAIRTTRNQNVINEREQEKYRNIKVGIVGLSTGSVILSSLVSTGGPQVIKIADGDSIEVSNLNRMDASIVDVGENKAITAARRAWEIDPFADIHVSAERLDKERLKNFILGTPAVDIFIDAMDSLPLKITARDICRKNGIPVLMATSNGDGAIIDVERYDYDNSLSFFNGRAGDVEPSEMEYLSSKDWLEKALKIVDRSILTDRVQESIKQLGKTLAGVPQLSTTVRLGGVAISCAVRKIANNQKLPSGRYFLSANEIFSS